MLNVLNLLSIQKILFYVLEVTLIFLIDEVLQQDYSAPCH